MLRLTSPTFTNMSYHCYRENINCILHRAKQSLALIDISVESKNGLVTSRKLNKSCIFPQLSFFYSQLSSPSSSTAPFFPIFFSLLGFVGKNYTTFGASENSAWSTFVNKKSSRSGSGEKVLRVRGIRGYSPQVDGNGSSVNAIHNSSPFASSKKKISLISLFYLNLQSHL